MTTITILLTAACAASGPACGMLEKLESASLLSADFSQSDYWALTRETESSSGRLLLARDGRFLLDYADPEGRRMGFDGSVVYTVDPLYMQVLLDPSSEPASFTALLESAGDPGLATASRISGDTVFVELEGEIGQGISRMSFAYLISDSLPRVLSTYDGNGNRSTWTLRSVSVAGGDPGSSFEMVVPGGYEVLRAGDL
ncbi:MAG TPA: outer membrane lipoprotein carrier protein LolA [Candidatus Fermentibacter sp.]|nr:outer membrane lipoprotein carrier protein LolA [Candidatus Fermentibacter sp.]